MYKPTPNIMKTNNILPTLLLTLLATPAFAQDHVQHTTDAGAEFFGLLELPLLIMAIVFSFFTAKNLKGGKFGNGIKLLAWGFLVMAIGHLHMQVDHLFNYNLFTELMGASIGEYAWYAALILTWSLSAYGFYKIYKASKV